MLHAIVFDFDGIVVDSEPLHYQAFVMVGKSIGFEFTYDQYLAQYIGFDDRDAFRLMLAVAGEEPTETRIAELCNAKQAAFLAVAQSCGSKGTLMLPGVEDLLLDCDAAGFPIAIASGATRADIELMLSLIDQRHNFDFIISADDVTHSKPDPMSYAKAAELLGIDPLRCLAIEDTTAGLTSARKAGLMTLGVTTTAEAEILKPHADRVIDSLEEVSLAKLKKMYA